MLVNQVALLVDKAFLLIKEAVLAFLRLKCARCVSLAISFDAGDVELGESEDFGELSVLERELLEDNALLGVHDVALAIDQVALVVDAAAQQIDHPALLALLHNNLRLRVLLENAHHFLDVESAALVVEQLVQVSIWLELSLVKFLTSRNVNNVALVQKHHPAMFVAPAALFVHKEALRTLHQLWLPIFVVKVAHKVVGVEVVTLHAEGIRNLSILAQVGLRKHLLEVVVLDNRSSFLVNEVALFVNCVALVILPILCDNNVAVLVSWQVTKDVIYVESAHVLSGRHINRLFAKEVRCVVHESISVLDGFVHAAHRWRHLNLSLCLAISILHRIPLLSSLQVSCVLIGLLLDA